ncbi:hypothetical protein B0H15DRAFT_924210 [Mycena belliarum]|uniref:CxC2-like cysteine cluster KDZ transposase-associated domain-containing protein n=1 Tax=Mycena belliarum TaxID=1033014 RepID=A0AAD6TWC5_9AGAR|nr:hypothetical protein B0H15DRAFT_924210 [Mycena belliae]
MFNSFSRGRRRDADVAIFYEMSDQLTSDRAIYPSSDGLRASQHDVNVTPKKRRLDPANLEDPYANWVPLPETGEPLAADGWRQDGMIEEEEVDPVTGVKTKRYLSSPLITVQDDPNKLWRLLNHTFLDELLRREGLAHVLSDPKCDCCTMGTGSPRLLRCEDCGTFIQCANCILVRHALEPLHVVKEWKGGFWAETTLQDLGLVYQLGHGGLPCERPGVARNMVVIHTNGIHSVRLNECGCDASDHANNLETLLRHSWYPATTVDPATCATFQALDLYRLLNVVGNINVHDYVGTLERLTSASKVKRVPDRYKAFGRMSRQYAFLLRAKRAGRANDPAGLAGTQNGECAVLCWTCPQDGMNLPEGWRHVAPEFMFLYMLVLAVDANFRLKNRIRKNEHDDPSFGSGWGYMVDDAPYREHLKGYVAEKDVSTCIAFAALLQKDTRMTTGLRCSGVGGVVCARHELVRPQGLGDLQKGERYSNMDYIFLSSVIGLTLIMLTVSYDIACQWRINLRTRLEKMPEELRLDSGVKIEFGLPVWHAAAHETECQAQNSLTYVDGVGRTDGEGIERTWSVLNPIAWATKEMGKGVRHDALEDRIDHHNWEKNINQGDTLARKLVVAIEERDRQIAGFQQVDATLRTTLREVWQQRIDAWKADKSKPCPYTVEGGNKDFPANDRAAGPSEVSVRLDLKKDELAETAEAAVASVHTKGATAFLVAGQQLEDSQRRIKAELKGRTLLAGDQSTRIKEFRVLQARHMPGGVTAAEDEEEARDAESQPLQPEDIKLWMPHELPAAVREEGCVAGLTEKEVKLREAQKLHAKRHFLLFRNSNVVGQRQATRSNTLIELIGERIEAVAAKYRKGWEALVRLKGQEHVAQRGLLELTARDVQLNEEREEDAKARHKLGMIGSSRFRQRNAPTLSSKEKSLSWIWTARGGPGEDEVELHESNESMTAVRVEWSKALARKDRWSEEVTLLREEMRRVMRYLNWKAAWWEGRRSARGTEIPAALRAGLDAYGARQAALYRQIGRRFKTAWDTSASVVVRETIQQDGMWMQVPMEA